MSLHKRTVTFFISFHQNFWFILRNAPLNVVTLDLLRMEWRCSGKIVIQQKICNLNQHHFKQGAIENVVRNLITEPKLKDNGIINKFNFNFEQLVLFNDKLTVLSIARDITERKLSEEKLKKSSRLLRELATHLLVLCV